MQTVVQTLSETGLDSHYLELELTETSLMQNTESAVKTLNGLREIGVKIAIDDFGAQMEGQLNPQTALAGCSGTRYGDN